MYSEKWSKTETCREKLYTKCSNGLYCIKCLFIVLFSYGRALLLNTLIRQGLAVEFSTKLNCVRFQIERAQAIQMLGKIQATLNPLKILCAILS